IRGPSRIFSDDSSGSHSRSPISITRFSSHGPTTFESRSSWLRLKTRAWRIGMLISTWKATAQPYAPDHDDAGAARGGLRQRWPAARYRVGLDAGGAGPVRTAGEGVHPRRQARARRDLGRDRRPDPRGTAAGARPGGGADRGAQRARDRRARARGGGDGRSPLPAARPARAGDAGRTGLQLPDRLRPPLARDRRLRGPLRRDRQRSRNRGAEAGAGP